MLSWFRRRETPAATTSEWRRWLAANVWQYRSLDGAKRDRVDGVVASMVAKKDWAGGGGFAVTDEMRVTISGVAALMTLGLDTPFDFPRLKTIILYPGGFAVPKPGERGGLLEADWGNVFVGAGDRLGEAWQWGPVVLSWGETLRTAREPGEGDNLVLHEFAHHLDGLDGAMDGAPSMPDRPSQRDWSRVTADEYHQLVGQTRRGEATLLDHYGASNPAEFFAVATECFFERPRAMRERHAELHRLLRTYFHQDPAEWLRPPPGGRRHRARLRRIVAEDDGATVYDGLGLSAADEAFTRAGDLLERGEHRGAITLLERVVAETPDDDEALRRLAEARLAIGDFSGARRDADAAVAADADDLEALVVRADALVELGEDDDAARDVRRALQADRRDGYAWLLRGLLELRRGANRSAVGSLKKAVALEPTDAEAHELLAEAYTQRGDETRAAEHRRRAEQLDGQASQGAAG